MKTLFQVGDIVTAGPCMVMGKPGSIRPGETRFVVGIETDGGGTCHRCGKTHAGVRVRISQTTYLAHHSGHFPCTLTLYNPPRPRTHPAPHRAAEGGHGVRLTHDGDYRYEHVFLEDEPGRRFECPSFVRINHPDNAPPTKPRPTGNRRVKNETGVRQQQDGEHLDGTPRKRRAPLVHRDRGE